MNTYFEELVVDFFPTVCYRWQVRMLHIRAEHGKRHK